MATEDVDVAIVGYGPVGVIAANLLGRYGISTAVVERDKDIYPRARAVTVNDWTMRIFQQLGLDEAAKAEMDENGALTWKTYGGKTIFTVSPGGAGLGQPSSLMIYQPAMEATLRRGVERYPDVVDVRFGETVTGLEQDDDGVTLQVDGGDPIRARYVLACDGGSSRMRAAVGAQLIGTTREVTWIVIDAEVLRWWPGCNDLTFWSDPDRPCVDIPLALGNHRWELPLRPGESKEDLDSEEAVWKLLTALGITPEHVRVKQYAFYSHHVRHADRWRTARVFLVGDSAHLMPPWAGQGMQSGVRDAHNIVWKLREVLAGRLGDEVLDSYQPERAPQVAAVTDMSQKMGLLIEARDPKFVMARNTLGPLIMRFPALRAKLISIPPPSIGAGWLAGEPAKGSALGHMIPQPPVWNCAGRHTLFDTELGDGFALVGLDVDPQSMMNAADIASWTALGARFLTVRSRSNPARSDTDLIDHTGAFGAWMKRFRARVVAVRPDRFVAATDGTGLRTPTPVRALTAL